MGQLQRAFVHAQKCHELPLGVSLNRQKVVAPVSSWNGIALIAVSDKGLLDKGLYCCRQPDIQQHGCRHKLSDPLMLQVCSLCVSCDCAFYG